LDRSENMRIYNMVENLCVSQGMSMPRIDLIEDDSLNAFASGISDSTYTISLSHGLINKLNDEELEAVIAHELSHIRNRDVRLLVVSIVFVGIFAMLTQIAFRGLLTTSHQSRSNNKSGGGVILIIVATSVVVGIGYIFSNLMRFAISKSREYIADTGSVEMTQRPQALASALKKIARNPNIEAMERNDIAQLFIDHPRRREQFLSGISDLFDTHPPIEKRITILEQY